MKNYFYSVGDNKVVCVTKFAGKAIKGIAKCSPEDTFDIEKGKKLAYSRCEAKLAEKRLEFAKMRFGTSILDYLEAKGIYEHRMARYEEELKNCEEVKATLLNIETSMS